MIDGVEVVDTREERMGNRLVEVLEMTDGNLNFRCVEPGCEQIFDSPPKLFAHSKAHSLKVPKTVENLTLGELLEAYEKLRSFSSAVAEWGEGEDPEQQVVDLKIRHSEELAEQRREWAQKVRNARTEGRKAGAASSKQKIAELQKRVKELEREARNMRAQAAKLSAVFGG